MDLKKCILALVTLSKDKTDLENILNTSTIIATYSEYGDKNQKLLKDNDITEIDMAIQIRLEDVPDSVENKSERFNRSLSMIIELAKNICRTPFQNYLTKTEKELNDALHEEMSPQSLTTAIQSILTNFYLHLTLDYSSIPTTSEKYTKLIKALDERLPEHAERLDKESLQSIQDHIDTLMGSAKTLFELEYKYSVACGYFLDSKKSTQITAALIFTESILKAATSSYHKILTIN